METVLITHARQYVGPGTVPLLTAAYRHVACHDLAFTDPAAARAYEAENPGTVALGGQDPDAIAGELARRGLSPRAFVSNDVFRNFPQAVEEVSLDAVRQSVEALLLFPWRMTQLLLPSMKATRGGSIVFVTSARHLQPEPGFSVATSVRAATTAFGLAVAREAAPFGVQVNVVAPNYLYSEAYYPRARFVDDPTGRDEIARKVPMGRLGEPREVGQLIAFLASGSSPFTTGQVIHFTGGWP